MFAYTKIIQGIQAVTTAVTDAYFNLVTLLLNTTSTNGAQNNTFLDSGTANGGVGFTITRNGNTTQGTFTPFSQTGWSNYFDGTGYLSFTNSTDDDVGSGDFTVEMWIMYPVVPSTYTAVYSKYGTNLGINLQANGSLLRLVLGTGSGDALYTFSWTPVANTWYHLAVTRSGTNGRAFINGLQIGTTQTVTTNLATTTNGVQLGRTHTVTDGIIQYLSNVRFVKGQALYTGAFTPATSALSTTSVGSTGAGAASSITGTVGLLTCQNNRFIDNGSGAATISVPATIVSVQAFSPFLPTAAYSTTTVGGSGYFDGTGDYLSFANNTAFDFSTGNFTVEAWIYRVGTGTGANVYESVIGGNISGTAYWNLYINSSNNTVVWFGNDGVLRSTTSTISNNTWNHIAVSRSGSTLQIFINGVSGYSATVTTSYSLGTSGGNIGNDIPGTGNKVFYGYISSLRVLKGTAQYTSNFTPPTAPLTAITNTSLLTNYTNAGIFDAAAKNVLETAGGAQVVSPTPSKFGNSSMYFDGTGDYLVNTSTNNPLAFGTGDFTIEFWLYLNSTGTQVIFDGRNSSSSDVAPLIYYLSGLKYYTAGADRITGGTLSTGQWYYIALVKASGSTKLYINGTQTGSTYTDGNTYVQQVNRPVIGAEGVAANLGNNPLNAYIDELRITKGYARTVTSNPTAAFPVQ